LVGLSLAGLLPLAVVVGAAPALQDDTGAEDVIVVLDEGADPEETASELGVEPTFVYDGVINGFAARIPQRKLEAARRRGDVARIDRDAPVRKFAQITPTGVDRIDADVNPTAQINGDGGAVNVDIAILDTGIARHRDLTIAGGYNCVDGGKRREWSDRDGHGTHVAGIAGARDNTRSVVGVAPGARLWAVKVLDDRGEGTWSSVICGLEWVYKHRSRIDVVNMSLGGVGNDGRCSGSAMHKAVCQVVNRGGIPVVAAAGNAGVNADKIVPATFKEVITVSAFADCDGEPGGGGAVCAGEEDDTFASFSNFGPDVDIAAPGVAIRSTFPKRNTRPFSGTSQAAPHVTGAIALCLSQYPGASVADVRGWLLAEASRPQGSPVGFTRDRDNVAEPVLFLGDPDACDAPPSGGGAGS